MQATSHWSDESKEWPDAPDGQYKVRDYTCPEFLTVVKSAQPLSEKDKLSRMRRLFELLYNCWDDLYERAITTYVLSSSDELVSKAQSSFQRELLTTAWIPTIPNQEQSSGKQPRALLCRSSELFLSEKKTTQLLHCHVNYVDVEAQSVSSKNKFIQALKLKTCELLNVNFMQEMLLKWSGSTQNGGQIKRKLFKTSLSHMKSVYLHILGSVLRSEFGTLREFFLKNTAIFVPHRSEIQKIKDPDVSVEGTFFRLDEVCEEDPTPGEVISKVQQTCQGIVPGPQLLKKAYSCLKNNGCPELIETFQSIQIPSTPNTRSYIELMDYLSKSVSSPNDSTVRQLQAFYIEVAQNMKRTARNEAWTKATKINPNLPPTIEAFRKSREDRDVDVALYTANVHPTVLENADATVVKETVQKKKLFASTKNIWVSTEEFLLINDDETVARLFESCANLYFLYIAPEDDLVATATRSRAHDAITRNREHADSHFGHQRASNRVYYNAPRTQKAFAPQIDEERMTRIYTFMKCCGIRRLSESLGKQALYDTCSPCSILQRHVSKVVPHIQKYIFTEDRQIYSSLVDEGIAEKLQSMQFLTTSGLNVMYTLDKLNVQSKKVERACVLSNQELLVVSQKAWDDPNRYQTINCELATLFLRPTHSQFENFVDFIECVTTRLENKEELKTFLRSQDLQKLPDTEAKWHVPDPRAETKAEESTSDEEETDDERPETKPLPPLPPLKDKPLHKRDDGGELKSGPKGLRGGGLKSWPPHSSTLPPKDKTEPRTLGDRQQQEWNIPSPPAGRRAPKEGNSDETVTKRNSRRVDSSNAQQQENKANNTSTTAPTAVVSDDAYNEETPSASFPTNTENVNTHLQQTLLQPNPLYPGQYPGYPGAPLGQGSFLPPLFYRPPTASALSELPRFFPPPTTPIQFEPVAVAGQLQLPSSIMLSSQSSVQEIGNFGEELVYLYLQRQKEQGLLQYNRQDDCTVSVDWANKEGESGQPFDIQVTFSLPGQLTSKSFYIEVKTTTSQDKGIFEISSKQLSFAQQQQDTYHLYRVFNAGKHTIQLFRLQNLAHHLNTHQVKLFMVI